MPYIPKLDEIQKVFEGYDEPIHFVSDLGFDLWADRCSSFVQHQPNGFHRSYRQPRFFAKFFKSISVGANELLYAVSDDVSAHCATCYVPSADRRV